MLWGRLGSPVPSGSLAGQGCLEFREPRETQEGWDPREVQDCRDQEERLGSPECLATLARWDLRAKMVTMGRKEMLECLELQGLLASLDQEGSLD